MSNHLENLAVLEKKVREAERLQIQAESRKQSLAEQLEGIKLEVKSLGVDPSKLEEEIQALESSINEELGNIEKLLPSDLLTK